MPPVPSNSHRSTSSQKHATATKSLTPKRKHRKMLKDGTSEVWPEAVESLFVEGLKQYWDSPWASFSRGRSRWRNAYLVEYLQKAGITRTKKQVASHIQVLRNMWKGEPEFRLVAGAEDVTSESESPDGDKSISLHDEDSDVAAPLSPSTPGSSGSVDDFYGASHHRQLSHPQPTLSIKTEELHDAAPLVSHSPLGYAPSLPSPASSTSPSSFSFLHHPAPTSPGSFELHSALSYTADMVPRAASSTSVAHPVKPEPVGGSNHLQTLLASYNPSPAPALATTPKNRVTSLSIWAEGMVPLSVDVDALTAPQPAPARVAFRVRLTIPAPDDMQCSPLLSGFSAAVSLAAPWAGSARCSTAVYTGGVCKSEESAELVHPAAAGASTTPRGVFAVCLPDSWLGRCRWLDTTAAQTTICQKISIDNDTVAVIVYDLDRGRASSGRSGPSAAVTGFKKWAGSPRPSPIASPASMLPSSSLYVTPRDYQQAAAPVGGYGAAPPTRQCAFVNTAMGGSSPLHGFPHFAPSTSFC